MTHGSAPTLRERRGQHTSLRRRLLTSYGGLAMLTVVLASGASLAIFDYQSERRSRSDMARDIARLATVLEMSADEEPDESLRNLIVRSRMVARAVSDVLIVDAEGRVIEASGRYADTIARFPTPVQPIIGGGAPVRRVDLQDLPTLYSASVPLPTIGEQLGQPDGVALVMLRPAAELRGAWRSLLPSIILIGTIALLLTGAMAILLARSITRPLEALTQASERIAEGDFQVRVDEEGSDELARLARSFNTMAHEVGQAHARQRDFVANVGHDLRTPLTSIVGFTDALLDGTARSASDRSAALANIAGAAERINSLVEQLLELSQLEQHAAGMELVRCDARALLERASVAVAGQAAARAIEIEIDALPGIELRADAQWLVRALANVIDNAVRHSLDGGTVVLRAHPATASGTAGIGAPMIALEVVDTGTGISPEEIPRVFERFYRGDRSRSRGASGLGLSIAREVVEAHGGSIEIASTPGASTVVTMTIPGIGHE